MPDFLRTNKSEPMLPTNKVLLYQRRIRKILFVLILLSFVWILFQIGFYKIPHGNDSMRGKYSKGATLLYDKLFAYHDGIKPFFGIKNMGIKRRNIIIFRKSIKTDKSVQAYIGISRVVGLPGDRILFKRDSFSINGDEFILPHNQPLHLMEIIPEKQFFVLNDNIASEIEDSRHFGYVKGDEIKGKILASVKPW